MGGKQRARRGREEHGAPRASPPAPAAPGRGRSRLCSPKLWAAILALVGAGATFVALREREPPAAAAAEVPDPPRGDMFPPVARAIEQRRAAVLADRSSARAWGELGALLDAHHLYPEAKRCYERARALDPRDFRWIYMLAILGDFEGAAVEEVVAAFREAVRLEPDYPPAHLRFGDALVRQGLPEEARVTYTRAIELDPTFAMAHRNLGQVLLSLGDVPTALVHLERASALDPADATVHASLARAYWLAGDEERAEAADAEAKRKTPVFGIPDPVRRAVDDLALSPRACDQRAKERMQAGEFGAAIEDLVVLAEVDPEDASVQSRLGTCYMQTGAHDRARTHLERAVAAQDDLPEAHLQLAELDEAAGRPAEAAQHYRRALLSRPENAELRKRLGRCLGQAGDLEGAVLEFERAGALAPPDAELHHNWGTALDRLGRREEACTHFEAALALEPENAGAHFNLALALEGLGRIAEAREHYERSHALDPRLPAQAHLAALAERGQ